MSINEASELYKKEEDPKKKGSIKTAIINFCIKHPDDKIPETAKKLYLAHLIMGGD